MFSTALSSSSTPATASAVSMAFRCRPGTWASEQSGLKASRASGRTVDPKKGTLSSSALKTLDMVRQPRRMAPRMSVVLTPLTLVIQHVHDEFPWVACFRVRGGREDPVLPSRPPR